MSTKRYYYEATVLDGPDHEILVIGDGRGGGEDHHDL